MILFNTLVYELVNLMEGKAVDIKTIVLLIAVDGVLWNKLRRDASNFFAPTDD
jgi:hypothetical protein